MLLRALRGVSAGTLALSCACASTSAPPPPSILPLRTLRLYETGVGYFERSGSLAASNGMSLPVPAGHLDDALKTLVVLDAGGGGKSSVRGVSFRSSISRGMARALAGLPVDGADTLNLRELLVGLRGAAVEVRTRGAATKGRLVEVAPLIGPLEESGSAPAGKDAGSQGEKADGKAGDKDRAGSRAFALVLLTDEGAIVRIPAAAIDGVRPLDAGYATRLTSALDAFGARGAESQRRLQVLATPGSAAPVTPVTLAYVAETPVWRTTYRLVFDDAGKAAVLEAWALVHNDTDEDWRGVQVQLVNGRPDSFLYPLAAPRYARRELVTPDDKLATVPQLLGTTVDALWGDQVGDSFGAGGLGLSGVGEGGGGHGEGIGLGSIGTVGHGAGTGTSSLLSVGNLAATAPATGAEAGALFVYTLADRVDLGAHGSALVPFAQQRVEASRIAWVASPGTEARSAVRFVNSTAQTLPAGTIAFFGDGGFAGESTLARLLPSERRFMTYGVDLDVKLETEGAHATEETKRLVWSEAGKRLEEHYLRTSDFTYSVENRGAHPREVVLVMSIAANATLTGPDRVDFDAASSQPLAVFDAPARAKTERKAHAVEGLERSLPFAGLTEAKLLELAGASSLPAEARADVREAASRLREAEDDGKAEAQVKADVAELQKDMERMREDMKALPGERAGAPQPNPFAVRLLAAEDKLLALRKKLAGLISDVRVKRDAEEAALRKVGGGS